MRRIARSSGAIRLTVQLARVAVDLRVELLGVVGGRVRERARERRGVALEEVVERPAGQVVLVEREDGRAALVGAGRLAHARDMYEPERVSTLTRSPMFTNSGTFTIAPVSSVAGLLPPPDAVSPRTPGSVCVTSSSTERRQLDVRRLAVDVQQVDVLVGLDPLQRLGHARSRAARSARRTPRP